ncbi:MAG: CYTH domain-containing protein [Candidatus Latescibacterota bacterium]
MPTEGPSSSQEIERKFLVLRPPEDLSQWPCQRLLQGYLSAGGGGIEVRLRQQGTRHYLTAKSRGGLVRQERQIELSPEQFAELWPLTQGRRVEKTRYRVAWGRHTVELDVYAGRLEGLLTAEVEFASQAESRAFVPPDWLGEEVGDDPRYRNESLALHGRPSGPRTPSGPG